MLRGGHHGQHGAPVAVMRLSASFGRRRVRRPPTRPGGGHLPLRRTETVGSIAELRRQAGCRHRISEPVLIYHSQAWHDDAFPGAQLPWRKCQRERVWIGVTPRPHETQLNLMVGTPTGVEIPCRFTFRTFWRLGGMFSPHGVQKSFLRRMMVGASCFNFHNRRSHSFDHGGFLPQAAKGSCDFRISGHADSAKALNHDALIIML